MDSRNVNTVIRATIPLLTNPLKGQCSDVTIDSLHTLLMSTLHQHLEPSWNPAFPSLGAASRALSITRTSIPKVLANVAVQVKLRPEEWVAVLLSHYNTLGMTIAIDPGMISIQNIGQSRPVVYWQEDASSTTSSPVRAPSTMPAVQAVEAPWNARKSRLPSLISHSRSASSSSSSNPAFPVGSPRTPSFNNFSFPASRDKEDSWLPMLSTFPRPPMVEEPTSTYRAPHTRSGHSRGDSTSSSSSFSSSSSSNSSRRSSPTLGFRRGTLTQAMVTAASQSQQSNSAVYDLGANMSQLSLASTASSSSNAPSLASSYASSSSSSSCSSPDYDDVYYPSSSIPLTRPTRFEDEDLPSPLSPTNSSQAYVDHSARKEVTEYECGKVGVLGGAVMLGVPKGATSAAAKRKSGNGLPVRGSMPNFGY